MYKKAISIGGFGGAGVEVALFKEDADVGVDPTSLCSRFSKALEALERSEDVGE
jgi:hypothetical protein